MLPLLLRHLLMQMQVMLTKMATVWQLLLSLFAPLLLPPVHK